MQSSCTVAGEYACVQPLLYHLLLMNAIRCSQSLSVDKRDLQTSNTIRCPLPLCNYTWCKICHQEVNIGTQHSCDGSSEFNRLMNSKGWKYCPSKLLSFLSASSKNSDVFSSMPHCNREVIGLQPHDGKSSHLYGNFII